MCVFSCFSEYVTSWFCLSYIVRYSCFFILGMLVHFNRIKINEVVRSKQVVLIVSIIIFGTCCTQSDNFMSEIFGAVTGMYIIYSIAVLGEGLISSSKTMTIVRDNAMGIYILHPMIIYIWFFIMRDRMMPFVSCLFAAIVAFLLSILGSVVIRRLKLNFLFGE